MDNFLILIVLNLKSTKYQLPTHQIATDIGARFLKNSLVKRIVHTFSDKN